MEYIGKRLDRFMVHENLIEIFGNMRPWVEMAFISDISRLCYNGERNQFKNVYLSNLIEYGSKMKTLKIWF